MKPVSIEAYLRSGTRCHCLANRNAEPFSMAPIEGVLNIFEEAGLQHIHEKSLNLTAYLMYLIDQNLKPFGFSYNNPTDDTKRGGHVSLVHEEAYRICLALKQHQVVPDFREPNVIRLAPIALYNSYEDAIKIVEVLKQIGEQRNGSNTARYGPW